MNEQITQSLPKRPRGRPPGQRGEDMRETILDAAEELFAQQGFAATPVRGIAERVGVNPAMIHYYFGSKRALLEQVMERVMEPMAAAINRMRETENAPPRELAQLMLEMLREHPALPLLVVREVMLPGGTMLEHFLQQSAPRFGGALPGLLAKEQELGRISDRIDPNVGALILLALCMFPFIARRAAEPGLQVSYDEEGLEKLERHICLLLEEGFSP